MSEECVELEYDEITHETRRASLFIVEGEEAWIPRSVTLSVDPEEKKVRLHAWFAKKQGLI